MNTLPHELEREFHQDSTAQRAATDSLVRSLGESSLQSVQLVRRTIARLSVSTVYRPVMFVSVLRSLFVFSQLYSQ